MLVLLQLVGSNLALDDSAKSTRAQSVSSSVSAGGFGGVFCSGKQELGVASMGPVDWHVPLRPYPASGATGRTWTLEEAYGAASFFPDYAGEDGSKDWLVQTVGKDRGKGIGAWDSIEPTLAEARNAQNCTFGEVLTFAGNMVLMINNAILSVAKMSAVMAFNSSLICTQDSDKDCLPLLKIIGGGSGAGDSGGIIGSLTNSIYFPLLGLASIATGLWVLWVGLVKWRVREAFIGALWFVCSVFMGTLFLMNPALLAKAPMAASNVLATCVVGAVNGTSCTDGSSSSQPLNVDGSKDTSQNVCKSEAAGIPVEEQMSMTMNSLTCSIWKAFQLETWSQGTFGRSFEEMDTSKPAIAAAISKAKLKSSDFCVPLTSSQSLDSMVGGPLNMDGRGSVCNVAAYQLYSATNVSPTGWDAYHKKMYKVIVAVASDKGLWNSYKLSTTQGIYRITIALIGTIAAVLGSALIVVVALGALIYYIMALVRMTFAPLFFLFGVHPGRGKKILFGFLEGVLSDVLKYVASALFLVISVALYAGILQNMENIGLTLIAVLIITGALFLYRKQIIDLLGQVNMGGQKLAVDAAAKLSGAKNFASNTAGTAVGAAFADRSVAPGVLLAGASEGARRSLKTHNNFVGNVVRESDRVKQDNKSDLRDTYKASAETAQQLRPVVDGSEEIMHSEHQHMVQAERAIVEHQDVYNVALESEAAAADATAAVLTNLHDELSPDFAQFANIQNRLAQIVAERAIAANAGDMAKVAALDSERSGLNMRLQKIGDIDELHDYQELYQAELAREYAKRGLDPSYRLGSQEYINTMLKQNALELQHASAVDSYNRARDIFDSNVGKLALAETNAELIQKAVVDKRSGQGFTGTEKESALELARRRAQENLEARRKKTAAGVGGLAPADNLPKAEKFNGLDHMPEFTNNMVKPRGVPTNGRDAVDRVAAPQQAVADTAPQEQGEEQQQDKTSEKKPTVSAVQTVDKTSERPISAMGAARAQGTIAEPEKTAASELKPKADVGTPTLKRDTSMNARPKTDTAAKPGAGGGLPTQQPASQQKSGGGLPTQPVASPQQQQQQQQAAPVRSQESARNSDRSSPVVQARVKQSSVGGGGRLPTSPIVQQGGGAQQVGSTASKASSSDPLQKINKSDGMPPVKNHFEETD